MTFLTKKKFQNFFLEWGVKKSNFFFWFNDVKLLEKSICDIQFVEKFSIMGVLTKFCRKVPFWGLYWPFLIHHWICLVKTLRLSTHMPIFKIIFFWSKKWQNWSKLKNFTIVLITYFCIGFHIINFLFDEYWES